MSMGRAAWDGPGGWEMDGTDGMGWAVLGCATERGSLPSVMREPSAALLCSDLTCFANMLGSGDTSLPQTALKRGVETMFS